MKRKQKKLVLLFLILGIIFIILAIVTDKIINTKENETNDNSHTNDLLGEDRLDAQQKIYSIIDKYIDNIVDLDNYLENNDIKVFSLKTLKDEFNIDTSEFENIGYGCNLENTIIDFTQGLKKYTISLSCDSFILSK